jgi:predicted lipoprotein with Yx(FWY)xxD motif
MNRRSAPLALGLAAAALSIALLLPALGGATGTHAKRVAKQVKSGSGETLLASLSGRTLYSLSAETHGRFICEAECLSTWHPLTVPKGAKPIGPVKLGVIERPEGGRQVTYRGRPLYTFAGDTSRGETGGEGFKDVGTWHAITLGGESTAPESDPDPEPKSGTGPEPLSAALPVLSSRFRAGSVRTGREPGAASPSRARREATQDSGRLATATLRPDSSSARTASAVSGRSRLRSARSTAAAGQATARASPKSAGCRCRAVTDPRTSGSAARIASTPSGPLGAARRQIEPREAMPSPGR